MLDHMKLIDEALHGIWGAIRIILHDPNAFEEFNISAEGFWRSFAAILPAAVLAWPLFLISHQAATESALAAGNPLPEPGLIRDYGQLLLLFVTWPIAAALLARQFGVDKNYARYMIADNWMSVPAILFTLASELPFLAGVERGFLTVLPTLLVFVGLVYVSWYVALRGLETRGAIAATFVGVQLVLNFGLAWIVGS